MLNKNEAEKMVDVPYGHDIEGSWLMYEAALVTENKNLIAEVKQIALNIADATYKEALDKSNTEV